MDARKRVLFLSDHFGHAGGVVHGATRYFQTVLPRIDPRLIDLSVCFLQHEHPAAAELHAQGIRPIFFNRAKWDWRALFDLKRIMRQRRIELVHAAGMKGIMLGRIAAHATGAAAIIHLHDMTVPSVLVRIIEQRLAHWTDHALVVSQAMVKFATETLNLPCRKVTVLYNGIVVRDFAQVGVEARRQVRDEFHFAEDDKVIGIIGRLLAVKDHPSLLRALVEVRKRCPGAKVLVVGGGPDRGLCEQLAADLALGDAVIFAGQRRDVPRMLAAMDVVAIPSRQEGYPYVALEALAAGKPVVASNVGGLPEIITSGDNGFLVPPGDVPALAAALLEALTPGARRDAIVEAARRSGQEHDVDIHVRTLEQLYLKTIACKQGLDSAAPVHMHAAT
jgi:glycosyltransferase involved in cell wall biosynthesis